MSYALGQPVLLSSLVRDAAGVLANATTVTLTITLPDGTTTSPAVGNPPTVTGTYVYTYVPTLAGLHNVRWLFEGTNASAPILDTFYIEPSAVAPLVSLADARKQCRLASPADDPLVQRYALIASDLCEQHTQLWRRTTRVDTLDGGRNYLPLRSPVVSITSVTENGVTLAASDYTLDRVTGWLYRGSTTAYWWWAEGRQNIVVTYVAGSPGDIPHPIRQGVLLLVQHLWDSQRGGSGLPRNSGADFQIDPRAGFTIPNAVIEHWQLYMPPSIA